MIAMGGGVASAADVFVSLLEDHVSDTLMTHMLQVGIGGRYDPTNFIETPAVSVVTSIRSAASQSFTIRESQTRSMSHMRVNRPVACLI